MLEGDLGVGPAVADAGRAAKMRISPINGSWSEKLLTWQWCLAFLVGQGIVFWRPVWDFGRCNGKELFERLIVCNCNMVNSLDEYCNGACSGFISEGACQNLVELKPSELIVAVVSSNVSLLIDELQIK